MGRKIPISIDPPAKTTSNKIPEQPIEPRESISKRVSPVIHRERKIEARNFSLNSLEKEKEPTLLSVLVPTSIDELMVLIVFGLGTGYVLAHIFN